MTRQGTPQGLRQETGLGDMRRLQGQRCFGILSALRLLEGDQCLCVTLLMWPAEAGQFLSDSGLSLHILTMGRECGPLGVCFSLKKPPSCCCSSGLGGQHSPCWHRGSWSHLAAGECGQAGPCRCYCKEGGSREAVVGSWQGWGSVGQAGS